MTKKLIALLTFCLFSCFAAPVSFSPEEDGRKWREAYSGKVDNFTIIEYTSENEHLTKWSRLATLLRHKDIQQNPEDIFNSLVQSMKSGHAGAKVTSKIIEKAPDSIIGEWSLNSDSTPDEFNIVRIFNANGNIYTLLYTTKIMKEVDSDRISWEKILKDAKVTE